MSKVALIIIFNHRFDQNIPKLKQHYKDRFSNVFFLIPFYDGTEPNVIPVYENSIYFQGYIAQGFRSFVNEEYEHYFFIADDMILRPEINEANYKSFFKLEGSTSFIPGFIELDNESEKYWPRKAEAVEYSLKKRGVEFADKIPSLDDAVKSFEKHSVKYTRSLVLKDIYEFKMPNSKQNRSKFLLWLYKRSKALSHGKLTTTNIEYPLVGSYSDIVIVAHQAIRKFCHYCGLFAASNLHVELAIPTALVLTADNIVTEKDLDFSGRALWTDEDNNILVPYSNSLQKLLDNFPETYLYLHPIKLSKWK